MTKRSPMTGRLLLPLPDQLRVFLRTHGIDDQPMQEYMFLETRRWRFDFAWLDEQIALEVEGGIYGRGKKCRVCKQRRPGAHSGVAAILRDIKKYNEAQASGWIVLRCTPQELASEYVKSLLLRTFSTRSGASL